MFTSLAVMAIGIILGFMIRNRPKMINTIESVINVTIYMLLFLLGISVGLNKIIVNNLSTLGVQALWLALGGVTGSVVLAFFTYIFFFKKEA